MIKKLILFLIVLLSVSSTYADFVSVPDTCTESGYYVSLDDTELTTENTRLALEAINFTAYTPVVTGISGNTIYFASQKDLGRFCNLIGPMFQEVPFDNQFKPYVDGSYSPYKLVKGSWSFNMGGDWITEHVYLNLSELQKVYMMFFPNHGLYAGDDVYINGNLIHSTHDVVCTTPAFADPTALATTDVQLILDGSSAYSIMTFTIAAFDDFDFDTEGTYTNVYLIVDAPDTGTAAFYTDPDCTIYEGSAVLGTTDNGGYLEVALPIGEHTFRVSKTGYWDAYKTATISPNTTTELFISLTPKNSIFLLETNYNDPIYPNSLVDYEMVITPIVDAYAGKIRISGITPSKVTFNGQELAKGTDGYYVLGDVSTASALGVSFQTPQSWGENSFNIEFEGVDIQATKYVSTATINYEVLEYPFILDKPSYFAIGNNDISIIDQSGTNYAVLLTLYDGDGVEIDSYQYSLTSYDEANFIVVIPDSGDYVLKLTACGGTVVSYFPITLIEPVTVDSTSIDANEGKTATISFKISNPSSIVKYYYATVESPILENTINKTFSIAPLEINKTVSMSFTVPDDLELENYNLLLKVYELNNSEPLYSGTITLNIVEGLILPTSSINTNYYFLALAVVLVIAIAFVFTRGRKNE